MTIQIPDEYYDQSDSDNTCFLCNQPDYELLYEVEHFDFPFTFKQCRTCGMIKQTPMPNEAFFEWFFNSDVFFSSKKSSKDHIWGYFDYFADEPNRLATSKWRYRMLKKWFEEKGRPLDIVKIGPATGTMLHVAKEHGHHVLGCDVSNEFAEYARTNYGVDIEQGRFEKKDYQDGQFDMVLLFNVIENVPNQGEFLEAIHRTLKDDGLFIFNYVDMKNNLVEKFQGAKYFMYRPPICYAYTKPVAKRLVEQYGFEIVASYPDMRVMNVEKILTLLSWRWAFQLVKTLRVNRLPIPLYAYPSEIMVVRKIAKS